MTLQYFHPGILCQRKARRPDFFRRYLRYAGRFPCGYLCGRWKNAALRRPHSVCRYQHKLLAIPLLRFRATALQLIGGEHINIVSYGGGANSTALLVGLHQHHIPVDLILFADTGGEHPHTYAYLVIMDQWLKEHGMPEITRVYKTTKDGKRLTLEDECLKSGTLPSIAYGFKRCSLKHKIGPQEKFCNNYPPCREVWRSGKKVVKFIGYDAGEHYRSDKVLLNDLADPKYSKWYPLMEWGWDREECIRQIEASGLPQPGKSSCFFCPSMRAEEIIDLREHYPNLFRRALALEDNAKANLKTVRGLGRNYSWKERFGKTNY